MSLFGKRKPAPEPSPPYDYTRERELVEAGDIRGLEVHIQNKPVGHRATATIATLVTIFVEAHLNRIRKEEEL